MIAAILGRGLAFAALWWVLTEGRTDGWLLGAIGVMAALAASLVMVPPRGRGFSPLGLVGFLGFFLRQSLVGGVQVAWLALRPRSRLAPAVLELPLTLPPGAPRVLLVATLSLMPGTFSIWFHDDRLRLHVLDGSAPVEAETRALEGHIARLFGVRP